MQDKASREERLAWLADNLGTGKSAFSAYHEKFGRGLSAYYSDRREALEILEDRLGNNLESRRKDILERLEELYARSIDKGNLKAAEKAVELIMKIEGLDVQKVEVKQDNNITLDWNIEPETEEE